MGSLYLIVPNFFCKNGAQKIPLHLLEGLVARLFMAILNRCLKSFKEYIILRFRRYQTCNYNN